MKTGSRRQMTPLEKGLACSARLEGKTLEYIADALRRDETGLHRLFQRRGVVPPPTCRKGRKRIFDDAAKLDRLRKLRSEGLSNAELREYFGVGKATITRALSGNSRRIKHDCRRVDNYSAE